MGIERDVHMHMTLIGMTNPTPTWQTVHGTHTEREIYPPTMHTTVGSPDRAMATIHTIEGHDPRVSDHHPLSPTAA